jgi:tetratricopeptide (TPR) repeat protein
LRQHKYRQALTELKKAKGSASADELTALEAKVWSLRGQHECEQEDYKTAENSFRQALKLGSETSYYWIAKCLVAGDRLDAALDQIKTAFEQQSLPKSDAICYLKLLFLKGNPEQVEQLLQHQPQRFTAAQKNWAQGVLALKANNPKTALAAFTKIKRPVTAGDVVEAWLIYTYQILEDWQAARTKLGPQMLLPGIGGNLHLHPILGRLQLWQLVNTGNLHLMLQQNGKDRTLQEATQVISLLNYLDEGDYHEAGHSFLRLGSRVSRFPELNQLRLALLTLAGQQSASQGELKCAATFWQPVVKEQPFNPQLVVNLTHVLNELDADKERQRLLTQLLNWLKQEGKRNPKEWPSDRLKPMLAHVHCLIADTELALDRYRAGIGALEQGERIYPESPEIIGRRGLIALGDDDYQQAVALLTKALEGGCRYRGAYQGLLECFDKLDDQKALDDARRRFGQTFGDIDVSPKLEMSLGLRR